MIHGADQTHGSLTVAAACKKPTMRMLRRTRTLPSRIAIIVAVVGIFGFLMGCTGHGDTVLDRLVAQRIAPEQHRQLADEYRKRAVETRALAAYHLALASQYRGGKGPPSSAREKGNEQITMSDHCTALAEAFNAAALEYDALAAEHDAHADAATKQPGTWVGGQP